MSGRTLLMNKKFGNVQEKLKFIQRSCKEVDLFPDLQQLFKSKNYNDVVITHGNREFGKDLVFSDYDRNLREEIWYSVIVKNKPASQNDFLLGGEIGSQIQTSFKNPYKNLKGEKKYVSKVIIVINGKVTDNAIEVIKENFDQLMLNNIYIWDYDRLCVEFNDYAKDSFLNNLEPHITHYQKKTIEKLSKLKSNNSFFDLNIEDINDIFVNVQTTYSKELKKVNQLVSYDGKEEIINEEDIEGSNEILTSKYNFIIHGIPTSGKTLFLKRIGIKALSKETENNAVFYIELDKIDYTNFNIEKYIEAEYYYLTQEKFSEDVFDKIILLFDSIDFISNPTIKGEIIDKIEIFSNNKNFQIILASRDYNYFKGENKLTKFKDTELLPFNFGQALQLVKKIIPNNESKTNGFIMAIRDGSLDSSIQKTPLALTLLAVLYRDDHIDLKELPANIFELYNKFTDIYLDRWDASKGITQQYKYEQTKIIISFIALHMHCQGLNNVTLMELEIFLTELRTKFNFEELNNTSDFIRFLKTKNNVFYFNENTQTFQFFNHYFQEFFTSLSIEDEEEQLFIDNFFNQWWANSLVFYAGKKPKSFKLHNDIITKIIPIDIAQKVIYLQQHSKSLQASHSIKIEQRQLIVQKMLSEYNDLMKQLVQDAKINQEAFLNQLPYAQFINFSKNVFSDVFSSKHISTTEIKNHLFNIVENEKLELITKYNISYFLSEKSGNPIPLENFAKLIVQNSDPIWSRIVFVDFNFLHYKKKIDEKLFIKIKRKMNRNKYLIQHLLRNNIISTIETSKSPE